MKKKFKKAVAVVLTVAMAMSVGVPAFAAVGETISPQADTVHYYELQNRVLIDEETQLKGLKNPAFATASHYILTSDDFFSTDLSVKVKKGKFPLAAILALEIFNAVADSTAVATVLPADASRKSNVGKFTDYKIYQGDLYYVIDYGYTTNKTYQGSGTIEEPRISYFDVIYEDEVDQYA